MKRPLGIVLSLALSLLLTLAGCSGGETASALPQAAEGTLSLAPDQPVHLAVVAGEAANSPTHDYTGEVLSSLLTALCRQGGHLTLVEADGAPYLLYSEAVAAPDASLTGNKQDQIVQAQAAQAAAFLTENAVPKTAEVDFVAALDLAARGLYAAFNGLSTAGPMDFTQNLLRADPEAVADALEAQGNLVDLSGVHVVLTGLGDVAGEQAPLTLSAKENLQAIWQAYLTRCGAASVTFPGEYSTGQAPAGAPAVTPVPVLQDEPLSFLAQEGGLVLDDTSPLRFVGDEATYLDEAAAQETLAPVAEALRANPQQQVLIVGTTASLPGQEAACQALSQARAETVQATLIELGVSPAQLATLGLGRRVEHPRILQAVEPYPGRWTHHVLVTEADQIDEELMGWLREAWDFAESKR